MDLSGFLTFWSLNVSHSSNCPIVFFVRSLNWGHGRPFLATWASVDQSAWIVVVCTINELQHEHAFFDLLPCRI